MNQSDVIYRASAQAGGQHPGEVRSGDGVVRAALALPRELGGTGAAGTNAEQLLAAAYAACFYTALQQAAREAGSALPAGVQVGCEVALGRREQGFTLTVQVEVQGGAEALAERARQLWPHAAGAAPQVRVVARA